MTMSRLRILDRGTHLDERRGVRGIGQVAVNLRGRHCDVCV
jgi:hypothetical protein